MRKASRNIGVGKTKRPETFRLRLLLLGALLILYLPCPIGANLVGAGRAYTKQWKADREGRIRSGSNFDLEETWSLLKHSYRDVELDRVALIAKQLNMPVDDLGPRQVEWIVEQQERTKREDYERSRGHSLKEI